MNIINEKVVLYLNDLYKPLNDDMEALRNFAEETHVPIILKDSEQLILNLLRIKKPKRILEIGTAIGYSACCFAAVCKDCQIITIEYDLDSKKRAEENIERFGYQDKIRVLYGNAVDVIRDLDDSEKFDFVFIDAGKSHYQEFFDAAFSHCLDQALIIADNVLLKAKTVSDEYDPTNKSKTNIKKMREFLAYLTSLEQVNTSVVSVGDGLSISIIEGINE